MYENPDSLIPEYSYEEIGLYRRNSNIPLIERGHMTFFDTNVILYELEILLF